MSNISPDEAVPRSGKGSSPRLRALLDTIPAYVPGKSAASADRPSWKLSSNENPYPPLPGVLDAVTVAAGQMHRYPDLHATELTNRLAEHLSIPAARIALGTGSSGLLQQLMQISTAPGDEVVYAWRSFESYPIVTRLFGACPVEVPLAHDEAHDLDAMARAVTDRTRLVFVCAPNNPTGNALRRDLLEPFLDRLPADVVVVLDEAYVEFNDDPLCADGVELSRDRPNVVALRTFSKAYGLAGLRVGYAVAHEPVAEALRKVAVPFGVSTTAQSAAIASLDRQAELMERVEELVGERIRVREALLEQGWTVPDSQANFVWFRLGQQTSAFAEHCQNAGVTVRPYGQDGVRITIGERQANDAALTAAGHFRAQLLHSLV
ncbi:histidinol-phosphate transaminase [Streptomyces sp. CB01635]|uniref:histidinol-phosphate transaminase n=1 Tax=unclassified Streptomyces TaxID=2593676 RepID=UPI000C2713A8|nr:histidinol-phosphate transaminase [Streptomyces sp. CB01635]PJN09365.1 histidinol-phosphate transaminase [Streptomyces sp. CB01635]